MKYWILSLNYKMFILSSIYLQCAFLEEFLQKLADEMERHPIWSGTVELNCLVVVVSFFLSLSLSLW